MYPAPVRPGAGLGGPDEGARFVTEWREPSEALDFTSRFLLLEAFTGHGMWRVAPRPRFWIRRGCATKLPTPSARRHHHP